MKLRPFFCLLAVLSLFLTLLAPAEASWDFWRRAPGEPAPSLEFIGESGPSSNGPTGLINVPTAVAMVQNHYNVFINHHSVGNKLTRFGANIGSGLDTPLELGVTIYAPESGATQTVFNLKFQAMKETEKNPSLAIGVIDLTKEGDRTLYAAFTKRLDVPEKGKKEAEQKPILATVGIGNNNSNAVLDGVFFGVGYQISDTSLVQVEYDAEDLNLGLRHHISENTVLDVARVNSRLFLGLSYSAAR